MTPMIPNCDQHRIQRIDLLRRKGYTYEELGIQSYQFGVMV